CGSRAPTARPAATKMEVLETFDEGWLTGSGSSIQCYRRHRILAHPFTVARKLRVPPEVLSRPCVRQPDLQREESCHVGRSHSQQPRRNCPRRRRPGNVRQFRHHSAEAGWMIVDDVIHAAGCAAVEGGNGCGHRIVEVDIWELAAI